MPDLSKLTTENRNPRTTAIDALDTRSLVALINSEDRAVIEAIHAEIDTIAAAIDLAYSRVKAGGRLIYMGAGTSGRLGVLDASECLPTFGVGEESVIGMIAGGDRALRHPVEAAEDNQTAAREDLDRIHFNSDDVICAISSSGRTPYCIGALEYAAEKGAATIAVACVKGSAIGKKADVAIEAVVGPEVITGSTRMKAGSAQKMILNMLSSGIMIKWGKVYQNWMVDVRATNQKLIERSRQMIMAATGCDYPRATVLLEASGKHVKTAIVMDFLGVDRERAQAALTAHEGRIHAVLSAYGKTQNGSEREEQHIDE